MFREGDLAYTLQRDSNSFGLFLLLTELKVGGSRRSIIIPVGRAKNGWRVFGLELRKMLEPENYVNGGIGQSKFVAQLHKDNSGVQPFKSFADMVRGHVVHVRGRNQLEKQNPVIKQKMLNEALVSLPGLMTLEGRVVGSRPSTEEFNVGKTNLVGNKRRSPLNFKSNWIEHVYGKKCELGNSDWAGKCLTVEVNGEGKRRVAWNKGGLKSSLWVTRDQREHVSSGSWVLKYPVVGSRPKWYSSGPSSVLLSRAHRPK